MPVNDCTWGKRKGKGEEREMKRREKERRKKGRGGREERSPLGCDYEMVLSQIKATGMQGER